MTPINTTFALWLAWIASWGLAAIWTRRTQARPPLGETLLYIVPTIAGWSLLFLSANATVKAPDSALALRLWRLPEWGSWAMTGVVAASFAFTWWARVTLGDLWSSSISRKENHVIVETGPYGLVRHPIYTGLIAALFATAVEVGAAPALVGAALMSFAFWIKARLEERFLMAQLGEGAYADYRRRTPMLAPFWPMGH